MRDGSGHVIVGGENYGQGSSREHAVIAPRFLGLRIVIAKSFSRIHWQNLVSFGILPLHLDDDGDRATIDTHDVLRFEKLRDQIQQGAVVTFENVTRNETLRAKHDLSPRQIEVLLVGGVINWTRACRQNAGRHQAGSRQA